MFYFRSDGTFFADQCCVKIKRDGTIDLFLFILPQQIRTGKEHQHFNPVEFFASNLWTINLINYYEETVSKKLGADVKHNLIATPHVFVI
jgi:hypothetical protein